MMGLIKDNYTAHLYADSDSPNLLRWDGTNLDNISAGNGRWPNAPNFCLGPPEISKILALVAQIYSSGSIN